MENDLRIWEYNWYRMKAIMIKNHNKENMTQNEIELMGDFQSFCQPQRWKETEQRIREQNPPINNKELCKVGYPCFKELSKLLLKYKTYYEEKYEPKQNILICPTCHRPCNGMAQLTKHRKNTNECKEQYWAEIKNKKTRANQGCGKIFNTIRDLENHQKYHCGIHINPFVNEHEDGKVDRRTAHGFGIPQEDQITFQGMIMYDHTNKTWNCLICNFQRNQYQWKQVYSHVRAQHCYTSREKMKGGMSHSMNNFKIHINSNCQKTLHH